MHCTLTVFLILSSTAMPKSQKNCYYQSYAEEQYPWLKPVPNDRTSFICSLCNSRPISMSNMGKYAYSSHEKGIKHQNALKIRSSTNSIRAMLTPANSLPFDAATTSNLQTSDKPSDNKISNSDVPVEKVSELLTEQITKRNSQTNFKSFFTNDDIAEAETLWLLHCVHRHRSLRDIETDIPVMRRMFKDSELVNKIQLSKSKAAYVIVYGLGTYFNQELLDLINSCDQIVVGFDESRNQINKKEQMDFVFRFWNKNSNEVNTRYFTSTFLGHAKATDLLRAFYDNIPSQIMCKILQISSDGPNVNLKFLKDIQESVAFKSNDKRLIDLGTCGLHVINNAFKTSFKESNWKLDEYLQKTYYLFEYSPARREDYVSVGKENLFPLSFTNIRWVGNSRVAERARKIIPALIKYVQSVIDKKSETTSSKSFNVVKNMIFDTLIEAKLAFLSGSQMSLNHF